MQTTEIITAKSIETSPQGLTIKFSDKRVHISWEKCSDILARATPEERMNAVLSPGGYGIHWPLLDEDLSVAGLLNQI